MERHQTKSHYRFMSTVMLRFSDVDVAGHVNNAVYGTLFESARCDLLLNGDKWMEPAGMGFLMRRIEIDFLKPVVFPTTRSVEIGTAVIAVGETSVKMQQALFVGDECCALALAVMVLASREGKQKIPDDVRHQLQQKSSPV